jgi:uncharacterized circularly permuted ATP-grasp superfamily protein
MLENREILKRFPELFKKLEVKPVYNYTHILRDTLESLTDVEKPILSFNSGIYNSAYFEHSYLAQQMGAELVEGRI